LTREEKAYLIMAHVDEKIIEMSLDGGATWERSYTPLWIGGACYRVKADEVKEVRLLTGEAYNWISEPEENCGTQNTHRITFQTVNGKPDCNSIRMEEL